jgi:hypothetical protein
MRACRSHPLLAAVGVGAIFGGIYAIVIEIGGFLDPTSSAVLPLMLPQHGSRVAQMNAVQTAGLLFIEVAGNVIAFAILFLIPVAVAVGARRVFKRRRA